MESAQAMSDVAALIVTGVATHVIAVVIAPGGGAVVVRIVFAAVGLVFVVAAVGIVTTIGGGVMHLNDPGEVIGVVAAALRLAENLLAHIVRECRRTGENPQVVVATATNQGVGVVGSQHKDAVVGIERTEERYSEQSRSVGELGFALRHPRIAVGYTTVDDLDGTVLAERVVGGTVCHPALKAMIHSRNLVPLPQVAMEVQRTDGRVIYLADAAVRENAKNQYNKCENRNANGNNIPGFHRFLGFRVDRLGLIRQYVNESISL